MGWRGKPRDGASSADLHLVHSECWSGNGRVSITNRQSELRKCHPAGTMGADLDSSWSTPFPSLQSQWDGIVMKLRSSANFEGHHALHTQMGEHWEKEGRIVIPKLHNLVNGTCSGPRQVFSKNLMRLRRK